jgi:hypothetical protein
MANAWHLQATTGEYRDYALDLPDSGAHGGRMILTLNTDTRSASLVIYLDDADGTELGEIVKDGVSLKWALAVAGGVDGFTFPEG